MGRLVPQFKIMAKPVLSSLAPSLFRLGLVLLGVIIGLLWAYQGAPIKFYDAEPVHLADGYKDQWIKMTAVELASTGDTAEAARKIVSAGVTPGMIETLIQENQADAQLAGQLGTLLQVANENAAAAAEQAKVIEHSTAGNLLSPLLCLGGVALIGIVLAFIMTFYWAVPVGKWAKPKTGQPARRPAAGTGGSAGAPAANMPTGPVTTNAERIAVKRAASEQKTDFAAVGEAAPVVQHVSTYVLGDDLYDDSFSVETPSGEFLGECGSGISETIGVGEPKKVTATEVWLFDKNDIRTVTKVLMSQHAYNDQALRTKLAPKGEAVLIEPGTITSLETQTLRVQIRIVDMQYGQGALPANSFFERLTVEIAAWQKEGGAGGSTPNNPASAFGDTAELLNY
ncbi:MAG TPA: hypothetical protein PKD09_00590 [Aggregatilinea sp.]|uniref:hypothetical protein n=1 Tax=Aggregatilinea sp. TaxID=2806333 RepID=UPI002B94AB05|nr:hypothetical protein [Aggregatilinea sp.]HML20113.1 hypothetical protein [Aggregatilinea sp.]